MRTIRHGALRVLSHMLNLSLTRAITTNPTQTLILFCNSRGILSQQATARTLYCEQGLLTGGGGGAKATSAANALEVTSHIT